MVSDSEEAEAYDNKNGISGSDRSGNTGGWNNRPQTSDQAKESRGDRSGQGTSGKAHSKKR